MAALGIVQDGDPSLRRTSRRFDLPAEQETAGDVLARLRRAMEGIGAVHQFSKGMGLAAPQIGIDRAAAMVRTPEGEEITLVNPRVIAESTQVDEQYEGCLSFFDVRGAVPRPATVEVEHQAPDGSARITVFERGRSRCRSTGARGPPGVTEHRLAGSPHRGGPGRTTLWLRRTAARRGGASVHDHGQPGVARTQHAGVQDDHCGQSSRTSSGWFGG
jgi:peptide deformylase